MASKYQVPILYVNQVGANDQLIFDGNSMIFDKNADLVSQLKPFQEDHLTIDSDVLFQEKSNTVVPLSQSNKYRDLESALVLGTRDYLHKCGFKKSGFRALGWDRFCSCCVSGCQSFRSRECKRLYACFKIYISREY